MTSPLKSRLDTPSPTLPPTQPPTHAASAPTKTKRPAPMPQGDSYQPPTSKIPRGLGEYRNTTSLVFMDCKPHRLTAGQEATCTARVPPTTTMNIPNRVDGKLYDVTYTSGATIARVPKNLPVEVLRTRQLADGTYQVDIRALGDVWVGPMQMRGAHVAGPIFLETERRYSSSKRLPEPPR